MSFKQWKKKQRKENNYFTHYYKQINIITSQTSHCCLLNSEYKPLRGSHPLPVSGPQTRWALAPLGMGPARRLRWQEPVMVRALVASVDWGLLGPWEGGKWQDFIRNISNPKDFFFWYMFNFLTPKHLGRSISAKFYFLKHYEDLGCH